MKKTGGILIASFILIIGGLLFLFMRNNASPMSMMNSASSNSLKNEAAPVGETPLPIPPLLKDQNPDPNKAEFQLTAQQGTMEFFKGKKTETYGYNGNYLGPVIRVHKGEEVSIKVKNNLKESTTVHWHGLEVNGNQDGGPHQGIQPGQTWNPQFTINQPAATLWYHPHLLNKTAEHVYKGLAGLFYIDDDVSDRLNIPKDYGKNDIPLVIQDRNFNSDSTFEYKLGMHDIMMGLQGNTILVNGAVNPYLNVPAGKVRLRLLNGSNARTYAFRLSNNQQFYQIASDGGLLPSPVPMTKVVLGAGERAEIIVDFSSLKKGDSLYLMNQDAKFLKFVVNNQQPRTFDLPAKLVDFPKMNESAAVRTRQFVFQGMGSNVNINGKQMDMNRIDEQLKLHDTEIWEISNESGGMAHPFHAHGVQFQILDRDGNPPPANEAGWKDTILINPGEKVRAIATFDHSGTFMFHCHILEHEDAGMMGQFKVQ
ncbi:multicopper oxidase family protein [Bacillota bacterium Lsc_1132]